MHKGTSQANDKTNGCDQANCNSLVRKQRAQQRGLIYANSAMRMGMGRGPALMHERECKSQVVLPYYVQKIVSLIYPLMFICSTILRKRNLDLGLLVGINE